MYRISPKFYIMNIYFDTFENQVMISTRIFYQKLKSPSVNIGIYVIKPTAINLMRKNGSVDIYIFDIGSLNL